MPSITVQTISPLGVEDEIDRLGVGAYSWILLGGCMSAPKDRWSPSSGTFSLSHGGAFRFVLEASLTQGKAMF